MLKVLSILIVIYSCVQGHVTQRNDPNQLHPVHGLYIKPSVDGSTGDLYVAATEEDGVKSQWLTDASVNFLPATAASQKHETAFPSPFAASYPHEETVNKKKQAGAPVQYAYAVPMTTAPNEGTSPYPYALPVSAFPSQASESLIPCLDPAKANIPQYSPFHFFYPQMMSAYTKSMSILKEAGVNEDTANSVMPTPPMWSPYSYPMYVMMDPSTWTKSQGTTPAPNTKSENK